jgi:hypothetical protein
MKKFFRSLTQVNLITLKWTYYNGFDFSIIDIEWIGENIDFQGALFGIHISETVYVDILFFTMQINSPLSID